MTHDPPTTEEVVRASIITLVELEELRLRLELDRATAWAEAEKNIPGYADEFLEKLGLHRLELKGVISAWHDSI